MQNERAKHEVANDDEDFLVGSKVPPSGMVELVLAQLWRLVPELLNNKLHIFHIQSYIWKSNKQTIDEKLMINHVLGLHLLFSFEQQSISKYTICNIAVLQTPCDTMKYDL